MQFSALLVGLSLFPQYPEKSGKLGIGLMLGGFLGFVLWVRRNDHGYISHFSCYNLVQLKTIFVVSSKAHTVRQHCKFMRWEPYATPEHLNDWLGK